jgi:molybdate transport system substrate-binding protein
VATLAFAVAVATNGCRKARPEGELNVAAATSLREVMPELVHAYEVGHPREHVYVTYGASGDLRRQVEAGAPVDVVVFAAGRPVDALAAEGRVDRETRRVVASNELVLVGRKGSRPLTFATLTTLPPEARLAVGDPRTVPVGEYARDYLTTLGEWDSLQSRLVLGANVAAVLVYARRGEVDAAIVYRTELRGVTDLVALDEAKGAGAPHPEVVGGRVHGGTPSDFLTFAASPAGAAVLASFGFGPP